MSVLESIIKLVLERDNLPRKLAHIQALATYLRVEDKYIHIKQEKRYGTMVKIVEVLIPVAEPKPKDSCKHLLTQYYQYAIWHVWG